MTDTKICGVCEGTGWLRMYHTSWMRMYHTPHELGTTERCDECQQYASDALAHEAYLKSLDCVYVSEDSNVCITHDKNH